MGLRIQMIRFQAQAKEEAIVQKRFTPVDRFPWVLDLRRCFVKSFEIICSIVHRISRKYLWKKSCLKNRLMGS